MHRFLSLAAVTVAFFIVAGCATTMNVSSHVERGLDFTQYRTYDWGPADALPAGDPRLDQNPFFNDHFQGAVEKELAAMGFQKSASPDLLIHYHANISRRVDINQLDRQYGYCTVDDCEFGVAEFEAGTLVLDVIDSHTNRLIWRGWAQDKVEAMLNDPDRMARQINEAVTRMLTRFPAARLFTGIVSAR